MKRPSDQALDLAEKILDHVRYGLTRADALYELADMIDESNEELLRAVRSALREAEWRSGPSSSEATVQLRETLREYLPQRTETDAQRDLFLSQPATLF